MRWPRLVIVGLVVAGLTGTGLALASSGRSRLSRPASVAAVQNHLLAQMQPLLRRIASRALRVPPIPSHPGRLAPGGLVPRGVSQQGLACPVAASGAPCSLKPCIEFAQAATPNVTRALADRPNTAAVFERAAAVPAPSTIVPVPNRARPPGAFPLLPRSSCRGRIGAPQTVPVGAL